MITSQHAGKQLKETEAQGIRRRRGPMEHLNVPIRATRRRKGVVEEAQKKGNMAKDQRGKKGGALRSLGFVFVCVNWHFKI